MSKNEKRLRAYLKDRDAVQRSLALFLYEYAPANLQLIDECTDYANMLREVADAVQQDYGDLGKDD